MGLERLLPYSLRAGLDQRRILRALRPLDRLRPCPVAPAAQAEAEVHLMLCRRDARLGVLALASLLRHSELRLAVTLTDDGSLGPAERAYFEQRFPGVRWLKRHETDPAIEQALAARPRLRALYHSDFPFAAKLLHPLVLARSPRMIVLDTDTAFFRRPERLDQWARGPVSLAYLHDRQDKAQAIPPEARRLLEELAEALRPASGRWAVEHRYFNAGLLLVAPEAVDLDVAERYLEWAEQLPAEQRSGKLAIWFGPWTREQTCYHALFACAAAPVQPLGEDYHLGGSSGRVFNHFLRHYLVQPATLKVVRRLCEEQLQPVPQQQSATAGA